MLCLKRHENQRVALDVPACPNGCCPARRIWVTVFDLHKDHVRVGVEAPKDVVILREEVMVKEKT